jgi:hypothetical protein
LAGAGITADASSAAIAKPVFMIEPLNPRWIGVFAILIALGSALARRVPQSDGASGKVK